MDTFMDQLAEKINAQEMIKANTTAELQELDQVKGQVEELKTYATQMKASAEQVKEALNQWRESANADRPAREPGKVAAVDEDIVYIVEEEVTQLGKDLEARLASIQGSISGLEAKLADMKEEAAGTREAISSVAGAVAGMKEETAGTREAVGSAREETAGIREETAGIREEAAGIREEVGKVRESVLSEISNTAGKITEIGERNAEGMDALKNFLIGQLDQMRNEKNSDADVQELAKKIEELTGKVAADGEERKQDLDEKLKGMHEGLKEGYHKECVKVYRNVQAAFTEENEKQTGKLTETVETLGGKYKMTLIFAILAFVAGLGSLVLQILSILKILP